MSKEEKIIYLKIGDKYQEKDATRDDSGPLK